VTASFTHRPATEADEPFLRALFLQARPELGLLPEPVRDQIVGMQLAAQRQQYLRTAPGSVDEILEVTEDGRPAPAGRVWRHRTPECHRLLDLAIRADRRRRGLGSAVLRWLCAEAAADGTTLGLSVRHDNPGARELYLRHGFTIAGETSDYAELQWSAESNHE